MSTYSNEVLELAEIFKALAHPARLEILKTVAKKNRCMCGEVVDELPLAQSTVSQHLKELKKSGLIQGEIDPPKTCYCINWDNLEKATNKINSMMKSFQIFNKEQQCKGDKNEN